MYSTLAKVVVVMIDVVVVVAVDVFQRNWGFQNSGQINTQTDSTVYRVALQLKIRGRCEITGLSHRAV